MRDDWQRTCVGTRIPFDVPRVDARNTCVWPVFLDEKCDHIDGYCAFHEPSP
jgi:hypothetical protein